MPAKLEHKGVKVGDLVRDFQAGRLMVPEFQRDVVWKPKKIPPLLDSLFKHFPISSLLVWQDDGQQSVRARKSSGRTRGDQVAQWLIDGQQRVTSLSRLFGGSEGVDVLFNVQTSEFKLPNAATRLDPNFVRVQDVWDDEGYRRLRRTFDDLPNRDRLEAQLEAVRRILDYEVPVVTMVGHSFESAVTAFERINTLGVKLRQADIESARVAARHSGFIIDQVLPFVRQVHQDGFDRLSVMHLFRACAFVAHPDGRSRTPLHDLDRTTVARAWKATESATLKAIELVRSELGLTRMDILWSGALLVPVIAMCHATPPREFNATAAAAWMALASLAHRYSGSAETALDSDLRACRSADAIAGLLANLRRDRTRLLATEADFNGSLADRGGLFAAYVACRARGLRDFNQGGSMANRRDIDKHHILPRGQFAPAVRASADCVANIAFVTGSVNRSINMSGPEVYLEQVGDAALRSQCVPTDRKLWSISKSDAFWDERRCQLAGAFNDYVKSTLPGKKL